MAMTDTTNTIDEKKAEAEKKLAFERWLDQPLVRMGVSMIPAGDNKDALQMLLRDAFNAGHNSGQGAMAGSFLQAILKSDTERGKRPPL